jgi:hypothetical protein
MGLLISAPGTRFPRGGPGASSALTHLRGLQLPLYPAGVECPTLQSTGRQINLSIATHFFYPCKVSIFFISLAACNMKNSSLKFLNPRKRQWQKPVQFLNINYYKSLYYLFVELRVFIKNTLLIGAEGTKTPAGVRGRGDPARAKRWGGSPARPRKAKCLERQSTDLLKYQV